MIELDRHPTTIKQNADGSRFLDLPEDLELPFPGKPLVPVRFPFKSALEVITTMAERKAQFDADQALTLLNPPVWENVGYVDDGDVVTAYYQIGYPRAVSAA